MKIVSFFCVVLLKCLLRRERRDVDDDLCEVTKLVEKKIATVKKHIDYCNYRLL